MKATFTRLVTFPSGGRMRGKAIDTVKLPRFVRGYIKHPNPASVKCETSLGIIKQEWGY